MTPKPAPPTWLPDWRQAELYPDPATAEPTQWRWEFMRRNARYQEQWNLRVGPYYYDGYLQSAFGDVIASFADEFGLYSPPLPPPPSDPAPSLFFKNEVGLYIRRPSYFAQNAPCKVTIELNNPSKALFEVNYEWPIGPQFRRLEKFANHEAERLEGIGAIKRVQERRSQVAHYRDYLRLLDGKACGATQAEMARVIFATEVKNDGLETAIKKVANGLKAAEALRDHGYHFITMHAV